MSRASSCCGFINTTEQQFSAKSQANMLQNGVNVSISVAPRSGPRVESIIDDYVCIHGEATDSLEREVRLGMFRDQQAKMLPPNIKVPSRKRVLKYLSTIYSHSGSITLAIKSLFKPGSWTSSGGSFKLASDIGLNFEEILEETSEEYGSASFLEIGAGLGGFHRSERSDHGSIKSLYDKLCVQKQLDVTFHFTNLTKWHNELPTKVFEYPGVLGSTVSILAPRCNRFDVVYSQCAVYFDPNIVSFIRQISELVRPSTKGGLVVFNAKTVDVERICIAAERSFLESVLSKNLGGMNGTLLVFRKR